MLEDVSRFFCTKIRVKRASVSDNRPKMTHYGSTWAYLFKLEVVCTMTLAKKIWNIFNHQVNPLGTILSLNLGL